MNFNEDCMKVIYFAFGSNMRTEKIRLQVQSATSLGIARILDKRFVCNKESLDGSAKANLVNSKGSIVWGVLFEIDSEELKKLDKAEGGYKRVLITTLDSQNNHIKAFTYISDKTVKNNLPYDWYKNLIIEGAYEHRLPKDYIEYLKLMLSKSKSDSRRH